MCFSKSNHRQSGRNQRVNRQPRRDALGNRLEREPIEQPLNLADFAGRPAPGPESPARMPNVFGHNPVQPVAAYVSNYWARMPIVRGHYPVQQLPFGGNGYRAQMPHLWCYYPVEPQLIVVYRHQTQMSNVWSDYLVPQGPFAEPQGSSMVYNPPRGLHQDQRPIPPLMGLQPQPSQVCFPRNPGQLSNWPRMPFMAGINPHATNDQNRVESLSSQVSQRPATPEANVEDDQEASGSSSGQLQLRANAESASQPPLQLTDEEKWRFFREHLLLILHAELCPGLDMAFTGGRNLCHIPECQAIRNVMEHMVTCPHGERCPVPQCRTSRLILMHWHNCERDDCPICVNQQPEA